MVFRRFTLEVFIRTALLLLTMAGLAYLMVATNLFATTFLVAMTALLQMASLVRYVNRTNTELTRFLSSIRYGDFLQSFSIEHLGSSFADLNEAFDDIMKSFKEARSAKEQQARYLATLIDHVPVALVTLHGNGKIDLLNNAARRLFDKSSIKNMDVFEEFGAAFHRDMAQAKTGETKLTNFSFDGVDQHQIMSTTQITVGGDVRRLVALQDIQSQLDATELTAWQDLVRVLSHEIMNSITPIASLARTASELVEEMATEELGPDSHAADVKDAINTVARRSEGLMTFVQSYKQLTQMAPPKMNKLSLKTYFTRLENLMTAEWKEEGNGVTFNVVLASQNMALFGDEDLLDQALINLLRNASHAVAGVENPQIWLSARINDRSRTIIEVADNGTGIDPEKIEKIFIPFYTTKSDGSGVGLALARQIMLVHKGAITAGTREGGGAIFRLVF